jgi:S-methylmethionine-dependent homocysteine/selenocysteine methylase
MPLHRSHLPTLDGGLFLTDGGLETVLIFHQGMDLPEFAAFPLIEEDTGRATYEAYLAPFLAAAAGAGTGFVLETPTWRASHGWGAALGWEPERVDEVNQVAVDQLVDLRARTDDPAPIVVSGCIGPMGDAYAPEAVPSPDEAQAYHDRQVGVLAGTEADVVTALTLTHVEEAIGLARAAAEHDVPSVISFTVETDGRLPSGQPLLAAVAETDAATGSAPAYYMVNCAHPTHFADVLDAADPAMARIRGVRANASTCSHAELDEATELDDGDPADLGARLVALRTAFPSIAVLGGCCGTDARHVAAITAAL